jgi:hypothetical protein
MKHYEELVLFGGSNMYITINKTWYSFHTNSDRIITHYNHLPTMARSFPPLLTPLFGFSLGFGST